MHCLALHTCIQSYHLPNDRRSSEVSHRRNKQRDEASNSDTVEVLGNWEHCRKERTSILFAVLNSRGAHDYEWSVACL